MARTRWPPVPVNPGLLHGTGRSGRHRRQLPKTWDPADESLAGQPERASADSQVRPGPVQPRELQLAFDPEACSSVPCIVGYLPGAMAYGHRRGGRMKSGQRPVTPCRALESFGRARILG
jgi:hypothetical protein